MGGGSQGARPVEADIAHPGGCLKTSRRKEDGRCDRSSFGLGLLVRGVSPPNPDGGAASWARWSPPHLLRRASAGSARPTPNRLPQLIRRVITHAGKNNAEAFVWLAFEQAAVYNAVVGITRQHELYNWNARWPRGASPEAAAAAAAHRTLLEYFPASQARLDTALEASLAGIPDGSAKHVRGDPCADRDPRDSPHRREHHLRVTGTTRKYEFASDLNQDAIDARVWSGIHFRTADVVGNVQGTRVGDQALEHYFQPAP